MSIVDSYAKRKKAVVAALKSYRLAIQLNMQHESLDKIGQMIDALSENERLVIHERYLMLDGDFVKDYEVCNSLGLSPHTYAKLRDSAFIKLEPIVGMITTNHSL
ncbi:MAG: hypothetical protein K6T85_07735 [Gorillibacterium sp.]|nr:hypothetical protein [Gorillibacterium sp.]